ncbi:heterokaryon incompatibility protein-domain-containing protein [Xylariaceae sp. FL0255]|nr:heterokaryon incompatibility protein-domain-containing protein [Xylariaceae sp. FL0255]
MPTSDYSLPFLGDLGLSFSERDVEEIWHDRIFPLVCTANFAQSWGVIPDTTGIFFTSLGLRCRVEPQPHHAIHCRVKIRDCEGYRQETISYEAIIFAKVIHALSTREKSNQKKQPAIIEHRRFINEFVSKLPSRWRDLIIHCDLHLYNEKELQLPRYIGMRLYEPLAISSNIRLLEIRPSLNSFEPIECTLKEAGLPAALKYEALSYVWGRVNTTRSIKLNGQKFPVGENLEAALRQLRPQGSKPKVMWIDAICIDQSNVQERTDQVAHMDSIFRNAANVEVWLGRESNTSSYLFDLLDHTRHVFKDHEDILSSHDFISFPFEPLKYCPDCDGSSTGDLHVIKPMLKTARATQELELAQKLRQTSEVTRQDFLDERIKTLEAFVKLLDRPWWSRVWVLQEVILARNVTLRCGPRSAAWIYFQSFLFTLIRQGKRTMILHTGGMLNKSRQARANTILLEKVSRTFPLFFLQSASFFAKATHRLSMRNLLSLTYQFEATDPRDKLFALVGLLPPDSPERLAFKPDYSATTRREFLQTAKYFIEKTGVLEVITARPPVPWYYHPRSVENSQCFRSPIDSWLNEFYSIKSQPNRNNEHSVLPSWVPDFSMPHLWQYSSIWINSFSPLTTLDLYMRTSHHARQQNVDSATEPVITQDLSDRHQLFNADFHKRSPFPPTFSASDEVLNVRGVKVDVIEKVGRPWDLGAVLLSRMDFAIGDRQKAREEVNDEQIAIIKQWKELVDLEQSVAYPFRPHQSRKEAFWRTLFLDRYHEPGTESGSSRFHRLPDFTDQDEANRIFSPTESIRCNFPPKNINEERWLISYLRHEASDLWGFSQVNLHCVNLSLFQTTKGYIGVGHPNMRCGDKVAVIFGSAVPVILREYAEGHMLIGQSYVHGIMDGEIIRHRMEHSAGTEEDFEMFSIV